MIEISDEMPRDDVEAELRQEYLHNFLMRLPPKYRQASFDSFIASTADQERALKVCKSFADAIVKRHADQRNLAINLTLHGQSGNGKTHLAISILKSIMKRTSRCRVHYEKCFDISVMLDRTLSQDYLAVQSQLNRLADYHVLVIDDCFKLTLPSTRELFFSLIDRRYQNALSTIFITNEENLTNLDNRVISRLFECGSCVPFFWEDYRKEHL